MKLLKINACTKDENLKEHLKSLSDRLDYMTQLNFSLAQENKKIKEKMDKIEEEKKATEELDKFGLM